VPSILPEVSGNGLWGEDTVAQMMAGVERVMQHLGMTTSEVEPAPQDVPNIVTMWVPSAPCTGLWYAGKELSAPVTKGELLGEIRSVFGAVMESVYSENDGFILYQLTSLSVNEGEALLGVGTPLPV
jgi:predicted deacylase